MLDGPRGLRPGSCGGTGHTPARRDPGMPGHFENCRRPEGCLGFGAAVLVLAAWLLSAIL